MSKLIAILHGTLIDGNGAEPIRDSVLLICDEQIEAVGVAGEIEIPEDAERIDARGKYTASRLLLQILTAADMICVRVGQIDCRELPAVAIENLSDLSSGVLIVSAVDQAHLIFTRAKQTDLGRAFNIIAVPCQMLQFVHSDPPLFYCQ